MSETPRSRPRFVAVMMVGIILIAVVLGLWTIKRAPEAYDPTLLVPQEPPDARALALREEVVDRGWIAYSARSDNGSWDIFVSRPDGTDRRNLTRTPDHEEAGPRFSPDGRRMLYRRLDRGEVVHHDSWGFDGALVVADADGANPEALGGDGEYPWGAWSPDGQQVVCLTRKEIQIVDIGSRQVVRSLPRHGIYQQVGWSPNGRALTGTGNIGKMQWCVVRLDLESETLDPVARFQCCTPDWYPDSETVIFSSRPADQSEKNRYGWTQLYRARVGDAEMELLFGEDGVHVYGGAVSPDARYILFTKSGDDGGAPEKAGAPIYIMRASDAPTIHGESADLRRRHPETRDGPTLFLAVGWEPCWTYAEPY